MHAPSTSISAMPKPRVVAAETPRRNPVHFEGLRASNGTGFLFDVMPARASVVSEAMSSTWVRCRLASPSSASRTAGSVSASEREAWASSLVCRFSAAALIVGVPLFGAAVSCAGP